MKAKITKPDGTVVELEGTPEEIAQVTGAPPVQLVPYYVPAPPTIAPFTPHPWESPFYVTCNAAAGPPGPRGLAGPMGPMGPAGAPAAPDDE
jgi:hypothetical protein